MVGDHLVRIVLPCGQIVHAAGQPELGCGASMFRMEKSPCLIIVRHYTLAESSTEETVALKADVQYLSTYDVPRISMRIFTLRFFTHRCK